jgi:predicted sulfurtransferase
MKRPMAHRKVQILTIILSGSMLLSSCGIGSSVSSESKAIKKVVENLLDDIQSGTFAEDDYESDYTKDTLFADLELADDDVIQTMNAGLERMTYKITDAEGDEGDEEGTCDVTITSVDLEEIISDMNEEEMDVDTLMDAIEDKEAPTKKSKITLDMVYDEDEEEWFVGDTEPLVEVLGEPFTELSFGFR